MEIKELVAHTQKIKLLRNELEVIVYDLKEHAETEKDNADKCGFSFSVLIEGMGDAVNNFSYGMKQINEGIATLEAMYRRSIRLKAEKKAEDKKQDPDTTSEK